ncbi:MAG: CopD family protein [Gammaproteobacteria bacterium]|nr:CopD family protein [Pseudomonadales bacterium]MCP5345784.1 CopD family protein [Pseudomonadales bacterium]
MLPELSGWDVVSLVAKLCWYFGVIAATGGTLSVWLLDDQRRRALYWSLFYSLAGALLGFHGVIFYFLSQVGAASGSGPTGMLNWSMIRFYLNLGVGETSLLRMAVLLLLILGQVAGIAYLGRLSKPPGQAFFRLFYRLNAAAILLLLLSFQATGHVAPLSLGARIAIVLHVLCVALWLGSLLPLWRATRVYEPGQVQQIMSRFSSRASILVVVLLAAAVLLLTRLLESPAELFNSAYGLALLIKALLVALMLALAALNRWWLVPLLDKPGGILLLRRSISLETGVGLLVLLVTVFLSTVIGPASHA